MILSKKWLSDFVLVEHTDKEIVAGLTMSGSKVEGYKADNDTIENVVVGHILDIVKHPDAEKLVVCTVDVGEKTVQIVTGATNVNIFDYVPVALHNSVLPTGTKIKKGKLRGVESDGMLCSLSELGLTSNDFPYAIEDGIFILQEPCHIGQPIAEVIGLDDTSIEFEITSNRPDCLSVIGLAREYSATFNVPFKLTVPTFKEQGENIENFVSVDVQNTVNCERYCARVITDVKIEPSPRFIRERLRASGLRPINNIVDITNYVMLEYGHPMHAFDLTLLDAKKIVVRNAFENEKITTLDEVEHTLNPSMLVIADNSKPTAIAGIMGASTSGINDTTNTVVFEAACFLGSNIRATAKALGMRTDSSARFEKGLDTQTAYQALQKACQLVEQLGVGKIAVGEIDVYPNKKEVVKIPFQYEWINEFLGIKISRDKMVDILKSLEIQVDGDFCIAPSFRADLQDRADIAEEIARIYGYDNIPTTAISGVAKGIVTPIQGFEQKINTILRGCGCNEVMTYSFISPKYYDNICLPKDSPLRDSLIISNPLGEDTSVMRTTTIPSMLEVLSRNYNNRNASFWGYEIGTEYIKQGVDELPVERKQITIGIYGNDADYYTLKGIVEAMLSSIKITDYDIEAHTQCTAMHSGRAAKISVDNVRIGTLGEVHPTVLKNYNIGTKAYIAKFSFESLFSLSNKPIKYKGLPKFPASLRDLSLICNDDVAVITIENTIKKCSKMIESVTLVDVYRGEQVENGKKSVCYSVVLRSNEGTLKDVEADNVITKILKELAKIEVTIRG